MIKRQRALFYWVGDKPFSSLVEAQKEDLKTVISAFNESIKNCLGEPQEFNDKLAQWMIDNATPIVDCLTTTPTSRARARKTNGGTKRKRQKLQPATLAA